MSIMIKAVVAFINNMHSIIVSIAQEFGLKMTDKDLHFWIIGFIGIVLFFMIDPIFKRIAKLNPSIITFIYTFTILIVVVFAIEIEQKITGKGTMDFKDITAGLWGFIFIFAFYFVYKLLGYFIKKRK